MTVRCGRSFSTGGRGILCVATGLPTETSAPQCPPAFPPVGGGGQRVAPRGAAPRVEQLVFDEDLGAVVDLDGVAEQTAGVGRRDSATTRSPGTLQNIRRTRLWLWAWPCPRPPPEANRTIR